MLSALSVSMSKYQTWKTHIHVDDRAVLIFLLMAATSLVWHDLDIPLHIVPSLYIMAKLGKIQCSPIELASFMPKVDILST